MRTIQGVRSPDEAKRLYGVIGLGGVLEATFGTTMLRTKVEELSMSEWLWVCLGIGLLIAVIASLVGRRVAENLPATESGAGIRGTRRQSGL